MNRLQFETSPYLRQHAHNPVDWYAWKDEAFEKARKENKPILVSIGYSTCHWCHVMERESFEDEEIAAFMNDHFVCIKVDREERPDIDHIYMEACQFFSGSGGWPLNCFLTPEGKPFYAGTYFPPMPAYNRPSWLQVLMSLAKAFDEKREVVEDQAQRLTELVKGADSSFLSKDLTLTSHQSMFTTEHLDKIYIQLQQSFDTTHGGFGGAPKFPGTMSLQWLLSYYYHTGHQPALQHALFSLDKMIYGGIYDQIGGGFARYATDRAWLIPHFEKMLYDNALLVGLLADAYRLTGKDHYRLAIEQTLLFIEKEMTHPEGGFYAALDADSEGEEGKFYVWTDDELRKALGPETPEWVYIYYGVTAQGNWEGKNILWRPLSDDDFAAQHQLNGQDWKQHIENARAKLMEARSRRIRPGLDDKILLGWNALQSTAYAQAYHALGHESYKQAALRNLYFLLDKFYDSSTGGFFHTYKDGQAQYHAFLEDYAFLIEALLEAYGLTFDTNWLDKAYSLANDVLANFLDKSEHLFYFTSEKQQDILLRKKELYDSATPSGNSTMAINLLRLGLLFDQPHMTDLAAQMLGRLTNSVVKYPSSFSRWATALGLLVKGMPEVAIVGPHAVHTAATMQRRYFPGVLWMASTHGNDAYPLLAGKNATAETNIYICKNYACQSPVTNLDDAYDLLKTT